MGQVVPFHLSLFNSEFKAGREIESSTVSGLALKMRPETLHLLLNGDESQRHGRLF